MGFRMQHGIGSHPFIGPHQIGFFSLGRLGTGSHDILDKRKGHLIYEGARAYRTVVNGARPQT